MKEPKEVKIAIEEPIFDQLRADINQMLRRTIGMMTMKSTEDAVITIKLPVHIERMNIPDGGISREAPVPSFKHEISSVMQVKDKMSGQSKGEYELIFDEDGNPMYRDINNGQTSLFNEDGLVNIDEDSYAEADAKSLASPPIKGIPETATVEEAEFEEVKPDAKPIPKPFKAGGDEPFKWLMQFRNKKMHIVKGSKGYSVRTEDDKIILSTLADKENPFYVDPKKVEKHADHALICVTSPEMGDEITAIEIWCDDCPECIFSIANPDQVEDTDYQYDEPES